ncbi:PKD domain protein [compost metagenome]
MNKNYIQILFAVKLIVFLMLIPCTIQAQQKQLWKEKQAYNWCIGTGGGLDFNSGSPVAFTGTVATTMEGTTTISSPQGELLFYAGDYVVRDRTYNPMLNGTALKGFGISSTQGGIAVPKPGNPNIYYLFGLSDTYEEYGLTYNEIDITLNVGLGAVTNKNIPLNTDAKTEKITAVYHANGKDIWVISHTTGTTDNGFVAYLVTENGINTTPVKSSVGILPSFDPFWSVVYTLGQLKASPDGKKLVSGITYLNFVQEETGMELFDFNNETGEITNPMFIKTSVGGAGVYGVEFSPNSQYVYMAEVTLLFATFIEGKLQQFDLNAGDNAAIEASRMQLMDLTGTSQSIGGMQLAPDGKIYISNGWQVRTENVHAINYPNNKGLGAGAQIAAVNLGVQNMYSLPTFIQTYFESGIESEGNCPNQNVTFTTVRIPGITSISWDFGDPASGASNISSEPVHAFSGPGTYTVTASITSNGAVQTATTEVVIVEGPKAISPAAELLAQCADANGNAAFDLSSFSTTILDGQDTDIFSLTYYATDADRVADNPIIDIANFTTAGQTIYAVVTSSETGCYTILPLNIVVNQLPIVTIPTTMEQCGNLAGTSVFNLKNQDEVILNGQNPDGFIIAYYSDAAMTSIIGEPESFISAGQTIYAEVTNITTGCSSSVSFDIIVTEVDLISSELIVEGCSPFNLTTILPQIPAGITVSFYPTEQDALNGINAIADTENYKPTANNDKIYIVATNTEGCQSIDELKLKDAGCVVPRGISPNGDGMNDTFDLSAFDVKRLEVFNRYGQEVYSQENYTDQWYGQGSNGDELPTGTYYYMIQPVTGEKKTGWVYINREIK